MPEVPIVLRVSDNNHKEPDVKSVTLKEFEHLIMTLSEKKDAFIVYFSLIPEMLSKIPLNTQDYIITSVAISQTIDLARVTNIVNIILDGNKK